MQSLSNVLELWGIVIAGFCGVISTEQFIALGEIAKKLNVVGMKLTNRQTILLLIKKEEMEQLQVEIEKIGLQISVSGNVVRNVKGCAGNSQLCKRSYGDALGLGTSLQERFMNQPVPKDFKISTAGCIRGCTDPYCADFGVVAVDTELFDVYLGGRGGSMAPRHGQQIFNSISPARVFKALEYVIDKYRRLGIQGERLCRVIDRCGISEFVAPNEILSGEAKNEAVEADIKPEREPFDFRGIAFNEIKAAVDNCCKDRSECAECTGKQCLVGFAKFITEYAQSTRLLNFPHGLKLVPVNDSKAYSVDRVARALAVINFECKSCMDNHEDNCVVNIIRYCLETALLGRHIDFFGSSLLYISTLHKINSELGNKVAQEYSSLRKQ